MSVAFMSGSRDGNRVCANITVLSDLMVECEENFTVEMALDTIKSGLSIENSSTTVILMDDDGTKS